MRAVSVGLYYGTRSLDASDGSAFRFSKWSARPPASSNALYFATRGPTRLGGTTQPLSTKGQPLRGPQRCAKSDAHAPAPDSRTPAGPAPSVVWWYGMEQLLTVP